VDSEVMKTSKSSSEVTGQKICSFQRGEKKTVSYYVGPALSYNCPTLTGVGKLD
jgi:hypothetical protein